MLSPEKRACWQALQRQATMLWPVQARRAQGNQPHESDESADCRGTGKAGREKAAGIATPAPQLSGLCARSKGSN